MGGDRELLIEQCREIFSRFDKDGDGSITELELAALVRSIGVKPAATQIEALFQRGDGNGNGLIDFSEFVELVGGISNLAGCIPQEEDQQDGEEDDHQGLYNEEELLALFKAFDKDGNGFITAAELAHSMARLGHPLSPRELASMMAEADADGDGRISFEEFAAALAGRSSDQSEHL